VNLVYFSYNLGRTIVHDSAAAARAGTDLTQLAAITGEASSPCHTGSAADPAETR
jgi:hypothetical protein